MIKNIYPSVFDEFLGKKIKQKYFEKAEIDEGGNLSIPVFQTAADPLKAHFKSDGTIVCFYGGGVYDTIERDDKTVTEYFFADLDRWIVRQEIRSYIEADDE